MGASAAQQLHIGLVAEVAVLFLSSLLHHDAQRLQCLDCCGGRGECGVQAFADLVDGKDGHQGQEFKQAKTGWGDFGGLQQATSVGAD